MERVMICGVQTTNQDVAFRASMDELKRLVETAQGEVVVEVVQNRHDIDQRTIVGSGKLQEMQALIAHYDVDTVIFNQPLTPRQSQHLEEALQLKIIDRIQLILDIFAMRARSKTGQLQVEMAQIDYMLPRLSGSSQHLSRLGGGIGTRGPGETKLETDRRHLRQKRTKIARELKEVAKHRALSRRQRNENEMLQIGFIGYTNAGKSTLLNRLTQADTYEKDELFATLDPLTKRWALDNGMIVTLTDTVGFIQDLPTTLIEAFQSTLEESRHMDILFHVVDASSPNRHLQEATVKQLLKDLEMDHIPSLVIYNKADLVDDFTPTLFPFVLVSAKEKDSEAKIVTALTDLLHECWQPYRIHVPSYEGYILAKMAQHILVEKQEFDEENNDYKVEGYAPKNSKWLRKYENELEK